MIGEAQARLHKTMLAWAGQVTRDFEGVVHPSSELDDYDRGYIYAIEDAFRHVWEAIHGTRFPGDLRPESRAEIIRWRRGPASFDAANSTPDTAATEDSPQ